jgi:hypothetical protein
VLRCQGGCLQHLLVTLLVLLYRPSQHQLRPQQSQGKPPLLLLALLLG